MSTTRPTASKPSFLRVIQGGGQTLSSTRLAWAPSVDTVFVQEHEVDLKAAKDILARVSHTVKSVSVADYAGFARDGVPACPNNLLIFVLIEGVNGHVPCLVEGHERINAALASGQTELPAVFLTVAESDRVVLSLA